MYCHSFRLFFSACSHWKTLFTSTSDSPPFPPCFVYIIQDGGRVVNGAPKEKRHTHEATTFSKRCLGCSFILGTEILYKPQSRITRLRGKSFYSAAISAVASALTSRTG